MSINKSLLVELGTEDRNRRADAMRSNASRAAVAGEAGRRTERCAMEGRA